jgi:DNA-binding transcriptional LysR family regulator
MDEFSGILPFVHVAETRSFTVAAHHLEISPSAVSKAVTRLEGDLGTRLFTRSSRSVTLTQEGQAFFERCRRIISDMEDARQALVQAQAEPRGLLRVTVSPSFEGPIETKDAPARQLPHNELQCIGYCGRGRGRHHASA